MRKRHILAILAFLSFFFNYALRVNLGLAILAMVNHTSLSLQEECFYQGGQQGSEQTMKHLISNETFQEHFDQENCTTQRLQTHLKDGSYAWDERTQGLLLSAFFWGYLLTNIPGGRLAERYGSKQLIALGLVLTSIATALTPLAATAGWRMVAVLRLFMGLALGPSWPAMHCMLARWIPPSERSRTATLIYTGAVAGIIFSFWVTGVLIEEYGWEASFYFLGAITFIWVVAWEYFISDSPNKHPTITDEEKGYIQDCLGVVSNTRAIDSVPLRSIFTSLPVWSLIIAQISYNWFNYTFQTTLPTYYSKYLNFGISWTGTLYSGSLVLCCIFAYIYSIISDVVVNKNLVSRTLQRKAITAWTLWGNGACMAALYMTANSSGSVVLFLLSVFNAGVYSGYLVNHIDVAPKYSGTIFGIANTGCTIIGIIAPVYNGYLLQTQEPLNGWRSVFITSSALTVIGGVVFVCFGSGEEQKWSTSKNYPHSITLEKEEEIML